MKINQLIASMLVNFYKSTSLNLMRQSLVLIIVLLIQFQFSIAQNTCAGTNELGIIPWPKNLTEQAGSLNLTTSSNIVYTDPSLQSLANILKEDIQKYTGLNLTVKSGTGTTGDIELRLNSNLQEEAYTMEVTTKVVISGKDYRATVWGTSTLLQAMHCDGAVRKIQITDAPDANYRGLLVDVARRWHSIENLQDIINMCRLYKINYLQLHLTDSESFTFPSTAYPLLPTPGRSYTLAELHGLEAFSQARGVTIVPEFEVPGHAGRMIAAYPDLFGSGTSGAVNFARADVRAAAGVIIGEMADVFQATPYFHTGCDEVDFSGMSTHPDYISEIAAQNVENVRGLFNFFINEMNDYVKAEGKTTLVWEGFDASRTGNAEVDSDVIACPFDNYGDAANEYTENGHEVLNTSWFPLYLVGSTYVPVEKIYDWDITKFGRYATSPFSHNKPYQYTITHPDQIIGAQTCSWEQKAEWEIPSLRSRVSPMCERIWNGNAGRTLVDYRARFQKSDVVLQAILATTTPEVITPSASYDIFSDKVLVQWRAGAQYPSSFTLYRNTTNNSATATPVLSNTTLTSYEDTNVTNGQTYYYWIKAHNSIGTSAFGLSADGRTGSSTLVDMYEPFDYAVNAGLNGLNNGVGFSGAWDITSDQGTITVVSQSLEYPNLVTSGNRLSINMAGGADSFLAERQLSGSLAPEGAEVWVSFLIKTNKLGIGHSFLHFGDGRIGKVWGNGIYFGGTNSQLGLANGETNLVVLKIESFNGNDNVHIWTNPVVNGLPPDINDPNHYFTNREDVGTTPRLLLNSQHQGEGHYELDEFRVGDSFDDVLPTLSTCPNGGYAGGPCDDGDYETVNDAYSEDCICIGVPQCDPTLIASADIVPYGGGGQDFGTATVTDNGTTVLVENNGWKAIPYNYTITPNTILSFDFKATAEGEEHAIGLDDNLTLNNGNRFKVYGTQVGGGAIEEYKNYNGSGNYVTYTIPIGDYYTGNMNYLFFIMDNDANASLGDSHFRNVLLIEDANGNGINDECDGCTPGAICDDNDACTTGDVYDASCNCTGIFQDTDNDGVCDANEATNENCPIGNACDDNNPCTINDAYDAACNCVGTFSDIDNDGVCDGNDPCPTTIDCPGTIVNNNCDLLPQQANVVLGPRTVLIVRGVDPATHTWKDTDADLATLETELDAYVRKISFNKAWIGTFDITPVYDFTVAPNNNGYAAMSSKLAALANANGYTTADYNMVMYLHNSTTDFGGGGAVGSGNGLNGTVWANNSLTWYHAGNIHESLHAFGLGHAQGIEGENEVFPGKGTGGVDPYHFMGSQGDAGLNTDIPNYMKYFLGWIDPSNVVCVPDPPAACTNYRINKASLNTNYNTQHNYALQLGTNLWLSYEPDNSNTSLEKKGVLLHYISGPGSVVSQLLDTNPNSITDLPAGVSSNFLTVIDFWDAAMEVGDKITWEGTIIEIANTGGTGEDKWVDIQLCDCIALTGDDDNDGICNYSDVCPNGDDTIDTDFDRIPDFCDSCPLDPKNDSNNDNICDNLQCLGQSLENFDYDIGDISTITTTNGGTGFASGWTAITPLSSSVEVSIEEGSLVANTDNNNKLKLALSDESQSVGIKRDFADGFASNRTTWLSVIVKAVDRQVGGFWIRPNNSQAFAIGKRWGTNFSIDNNGSNLPMENGKAYWLVAKYDLQETETIVQLWVNPTLSELQNSTTPDATKTTGTLGNISSIVIAVSGHGAGTYEVDALEMLCEAPTTLPLLDSNSNGLPDSDEACPDSDNDGVCDAEDTCTGGDDTIDANANGIPDFCEVPNTVADYCTSTANSATYEHIKQVVFGSIDNLSNNDNGYGDYTNIKTIVTPGQIVPIALSPGFKDKAYEEYWKIWIDYNLDGDFDDVNEMVFSQNSNSTITGMVNVPTNVATGLTKMRVAMQWKTNPLACESINFGEVEDYSIEIMACDNSEGIACDDGDSCTVDDQFDANCNCTGRSVDRDADGICDSQDACPDDASNSCANATPNYCEATSSSTRYEYIETINFANLANTSGIDEGYGDYTSKTAQVRVGSSELITLVPGFDGKSFAESWVVWLDYNQDGDFDDANEMVFSGTGESTLTGTITIPNDALIGTTRMRIVMQWKTPASSPCEYIKFGEIEDYTVEIQASNLQEGALSRTKITNLPIEAASLLLYPNPAKEVLHIHTTITSAAQLKIYTSQGQLVHQQFVAENASTISLSLSTFPSGLFTVVIKSKDSDALVKRFIKQ